MTPAPPPLFPLQYEDLLRRALQEDLGAAGDLTSDAIVPPGRLAEAALVVRPEARLCGLDVALAVFRLLAPELRVERRAGDGEDMVAGAAVARLIGPARALLAAERTALNLLGRMTGIATATRSVVASLVGTGARIACTRKTTPGLRALEKYAVRVGGGINHRFGLHDGVLVKDNHREVAGGVGEALRRVRERLGHMVKVEVEVDDLAQLEEALAAGADLVLLDNFSLANLRRAVELARGRAATEASGGITPERAPEIAASGVDILSLGWLTHSAPAADVSLEL